MRRSEVYGNGNHAQDLAQLLRKSEGQAPSNTDAISTTSTTDMLASDRRPLPPVITTTSTHVLQAHTTVSPTMSPTMVVSTQRPSVSNQIVMKGMLLRRDRTFLTWKWREFVLERHRLQYFNEKGHRKGEIPITSTTPITIRLLENTTPSNGASSKQPFAFVLFIQDEKLTLAAKNDDDRKAWMHVLVEIFYANVEILGNVDRKHAKPTFLPIPDMQQQQSERFPLHETAISPSMASDIPILESRMTYGPLKELYSRITFPPSLANGDLLVGVGPLVRRMGWTDERILAVGMYIDPEAAQVQLEDRFHGRTAKSVYGDQTFYDALMTQSTFRRSFVITSRKRVSKHVLCALLHDELAPRMMLMANGQLDALEMLVGFIEKSLKKAESIVLRLNPDVGRFELRFRGVNFPPIASTALCHCIQAWFFDSQSIQYDAKRGLIERLPSLWGGEVIDEQDEVFGALLVSEPRTKVATNPSESTMDSNDETPKEEDNEQDDEEDDDDDEEEEEEDLNELDEQEHEMLRRESRSVLVRFGPLLDPDSHVEFRGSLASDASALLGTWSTELLPNHHEEEPQDSNTKARRKSLAPALSFSIGLYVDPGAATETLLQYKGLSTGSILQDPDFFSRFAKGAFTKHLVVKCRHDVKLRLLLEFLVMHLRRSVPAGTSSEGEASDRQTPASQLSKALESYQDSVVLHPKDEMLFSIAADGSMSMSLVPSASSHTERCIQDVEMPAPPFAQALQALFYGYQTIDSVSKPQLMLRLPTLLDLAKDDLVHTYHDEIQALRENYKRQRPENRVKVGYLLLSFEKKKRIKNADGIKETTTTASRWSKRWCRLDGTLFSYYSHKRKKKPREVIDLTQCHVSEITSSSCSEMALFAFEKQKRLSHVRPSTKIGILKPTGAVLALKTESIYEGAEWLESLIDASRVYQEEMTMAPHADDSVQSPGSTTLASPVAEHEAYATEQAVVLDKEASLIEWIREDARHAMIFGLLLAMVWLVSTRDPIDRVVIST